MMSKVRVFVTGVLVPDTSSETLTVKVPATVGVPLRVSVALPFSGKIPSIALVIVTPAGKPVTVALKGARPT